MSQVIPKVRFSFASVFLVTMTCSLCIAADSVEPVLTYSLGVGLIRQPEYPGSDDQKTQALPVFKLRYGWFYAGVDPANVIPAGIGYDLYTDGHWRLGGGFSFDSTERSPSDDPDLVRLAEIDQTVRANFYARYGTQRWLVRGILATDIEEGDQGTWLRLEGFWIEHIGARFTWVVGPSLVWSDHEFVETYFGITREQSLVSGLPEYKTESGLYSARFIWAGHYRFDPDWNFSLIYSVGRLQGDAVDSPIRQDRSQNRLVTFINYVF